MKEINPSAEHFVQWLKKAILAQKLIINEPQALVHTVNDIIFKVTPDIFMHNVQEFPQVQSLEKANNKPSRRYMQKAFEKLKFHKQLDKGLSISTYLIEEPKNTKKVHSYLFI